MQLKVRKGAWLSHQTAQSQCWNIKLHFLPWVQTATYLFFFREQFWLSIHFCMCYEQDSTAKVFLVCLLAGLQDSAAEVLFALLTVQLFRLHSTVVWRHVIFLIFFGFSPCAFSSMTFVLFLSGDMRLSFLNVLLAGCLISWCLCLAYTRFCRLPLMLLLLWCQSGGYGVL